VPTSEFIGAGYKYRETCNLVQALQPLTHRINAILKTLDPEHYEEALKVRDVLKVRHAGYLALCVIDPGVYEGRELLFNRTSGQHRDSQDPPKAWAILAAFGNFKGGDVFIESLGLRIRFEPGDVIALRGRVVPHEIMDDYEGQRISIPHFTHSATWEAVGNRSVFLD
jgi:hypothetical protein